MGTEELNALRCGTCDKRRIGNIGQIECKMTGYPVSKEEPACISHSRLTEFEMTNNKNNHYVKNSN